MVIDYALEKYHSANQQVFNPDGKLYAQIQRVRSSGLAARARIVHDIVTIIFAVVARAQAGARSACVYYVHTNPLDSYAECENRFCLVLARSQR